MTPYYADESVTLYHGDCRDVLPTLLPQSVDVVATDPPYGMAFGGFRGVQMNVKADGARQGIRLVRQAMFELRDALTEEAHAYVFCHWESWPDFYDALSPFMPIKNALIWWKNRGGMGDVVMEYSRDYEVILYAARGRRALAGRRDGSVISGIPPEGNTATRHHPTEKPIRLMGYLIERSCPPGGTVLDPFAGSGSTLVAAKQLGRRAVGVELDERYCEIAARRLDQGVLDFGEVG